MPLEHGKGSTISPSGHQKKAGFLNAKLSKEFVNYKPRKSQRLSKTITPEYLKKIHIFSVLFSTHLFGFSHFKQDVP
jgi:hypothetical protein